MSDQSTISAEAIAQVRDIGERAQLASRQLVVLSRDHKDAALASLADAVQAAAADIVAANSADMERGRSTGMSAGLLDRLSLDIARVDAIAQSLRDVAALPDPVGEVVRGSTLGNGLEIRQIRVPMGVIGMIYEARPNVTVEAAGLGLKSGNAIILRGGSAAADTNRALVSVMRTALAASGIPQDAISLLDGGGHDAVRALMTARGLVDLLIPRGGAELINSVVLNSTVPVIETGIGINHVYIDADADPDKALAITVNAKTQRPSVCNSAETLLVHQDIAPDVLPKILNELATRGVQLRVDQAAQQYAEAAGVRAELATGSDFDTEWHDLVMSVAVVPDLAAALEHVRQHGSGHTEAIVTENRTAARRWIAQVDAAAVVVNASTRFTDGGQFGFGAEIGISTQKLHARGPMALPELTTTKWVVDGDGQVRE